jgi:hypothetical protein
VRDNSSVLRRKGYRTDARREGDTPPNKQMQRTRHGLDGASPLICVFDGLLPRPAPTYHLRASFLVLLAALFASCRCTDDMPLSHPEGLLPGYSELKCELWDYDSGVISYTYTLPEGVQPEAGLDILEAQVNRSLWRDGSRPPVSCYQRRTRRPGYLLTVCEDPGNGPPWAWEFEVRDSKVRVTTGGAQYVLAFPREGYSIREPSNNAADEAWLGWSFAADLSVRRAPTHPREVT